MGVEKDGESEMDGEEEERRSAGYGWRGQAAFR